MSRRTWLITGVVAALAAVGLGWLLWPGGEKSEPRARQYTDATACLLTPATGVTDSTTAPVWAGMQRASLATHGKIRYLSVIGDQSGDNAATYLATLALGGCGLIVAAGPAPVAAVDSHAATYPAQHFAIVGEAKAQPNVALIRGADAASTGEATRALVSDALSATVH